ncbi:MAG: glycosyltransferase [Chloroflexi bacterium]|nr:glycosyltransferase [Chloroflexota bacterium]
MKILHVYKDYYPVLGGIENHVRLLAERQVQSGQEVTVLVTGPERHTTVENDNGIVVIRTGRLATVASTPLSLSLALHLRRIQADIHHLHFPYPVGEVANLLLAPSQPTVITYHSDVVRQQGFLRLYQPILWQVLRRATAIIATSPNYVKSSPFLSRLPATKIRVIPLGVDLEPLLRPQREPVVHMRNIYPTPIWLFVGRMRYYKGLQYFLQAMPQLPGTLIAIGIGPMLAEWQQLAKELGLAGRVIFPGEIPDALLPAYYQACDAFVLPASERSEAFGTVIIEAMAAGKPVISTEIGTGTSWINLDGITGLVVPPRDPQALATAASQLAEHKTLCVQYGEAARARALEFSADALHHRVLDLYRQILEPQ